MITKYWAYDDVIFSENFSRETEKTLVTDLGFTKKKSGRQWAYKDSFEDAKNYLLKQAEEQLTQAQIKYERIKNLQPSSSLPR